MIIEPADTDRPVTVRAATTIFAQVQARATGTTLLPPVSRTANSLAGVKRVCLRNQETMKLATIDQKAEK